MFSAAFPATPGRTAWPVAGFGASGSSCVSPGLMQELNKRMETASRNTYVWHPDGEPDRLVVITRLKQADGTRVLEFLDVKQSQVIRLSSNGQVLSATAAGMTGQIRMSRQQAKSVVENCLMRIFLPNG